MRIRVLSLVLTAAIAAVFASSAPAGVRDQQLLAGRLLAQVNAVRAANGLVPVRASAQLTQAAASHTREMAKLGYFAHESADGSGLARRVAGWYSPAGRSFWSVGENLLWSAPRISASTMVARWLASPEHRSVLLDPTWREVGIFAGRVSTAPGFYANRPVTIVTADFGVRH